VSHEKSQILSCLVANDRFNDRRNTYIYIQDVSRRIVNILGGGSMHYSE